MVKYTYSVVILDMSATAASIDVFCARANSTTRYAPVKTIYRFSLVPYSGHFQSSDAISGIGCYGNNTIYLDMWLRSYEYMWLPVMSLFCSIGVSLNARIPK